MDSTTLPSRERGHVKTTFDGAVATVTLSLPARFNVISAAMWQELARTFTALSADASCRAVIIAGSAQQFSAGADITEFPHVRHTPDQVYSYHEHILAPALRAVSACVHPTVAVIEGVCIGGGLEIACCCDLRIASATSRLGAPINRLGFPMAPQEIEVILTVAGRAVALELLLEGRLLDAAEALSKGLLTRVVPDAEIEHATRQCVSRLLEGAPIAARLNKDTVRRLAERSPCFSAEERRTFFDAWSDSPDHREGIRAFLEKRPPAFRGNGVGPAV